MESEREYMFGAKLGTVDYRWREYLLKNNMSRNAPRAQDAFYAFYALGFYFR
jgi:hypothetical protein